MSDDRAYRILVSHDVEKNDFVARIPELNVEARAATRAEALTEAEHALEQQVAGALEDKRSLPKPIDLSTIDGALSLQLSAPLVRDLAHHARASGVSREELASQLLARAIGALDGSVRRDRPPQQSQAPRQTNDGDNRGNNLNERDRGNERAGDPGGQDRRGPGGNNRGRQREGYRPELDDKANFMEYVRGLEKGGGGRGRR
jgi:predicted RNase H-like HicB family nuclease